MDVGHLRSVLPPRFAKALAAASSRCRAQQLVGPSPGPGLDASTGRPQPKQVILAATEAAGPPAQDDVQQSNKLACKQPQSHRPGKRRCIPQLDGNEDDDDEHYYAEEAEGGPDEEEEGGCGAGEVVAGSGEVVAGSGEVVAGSGEVVVVVVGRARP
eukprot:gene4614-4868_t